MARDFVAASTQYLYNTSVPAVGSAFSLSFWVTNLTTGGIRCVFSDKGDAGGSDNTTWFVWFDASGTLWFTLSGVSDYDMSAGTYSTTRTHVTIVRNGTSCISYRDGAQDISLTIGTMGTARTGVNIGAYNDYGARDYYFDGELAWVGFWNTNLSAAEAYSLSRGYHPSLIRPASLVEAWDLYGNSSPEPGHRRVYAMTLSGSPAKAAQPSQFLHNGRMARLVAPAAVSGAIAGTAAGTSTATGTATGAGALVGTAAGVGAATGAGGGAGALARTADGPVDPTGPAVASGARVATADGVGAASGTVTGAGALVGTSAGVGAATGTAVGAGVLAGTSAGVGAATGTLEQGLLTGLSFAHHLDETSGTRDDAFSTFDLTDNNTVAGGTGKLDGCATFVRANTEYLSVADDAVFRGSADFSRVIWMKLTNKTQSNVVLSKWQGGSAAQEYSVYYDQATDRFVFDYKDADFDLRSVSASSFGSPSTATWYMLYVEYDISTRTIGISVNAGTLDTFVHPVSKVMNVQTGAYHLAQDATRGAADIELDEHNGWARLLTQGEIEDLYNSGTGLAYPFVPASPLAGTAAGTCTVTGTLTGAGAVAATAGGTGTATGTLAGAGALLGSAAGVGTATATGFLYGVLSGAIPGSCTVTATLYGSGVLAGTAEGVGTLTGTLFVPSIGSDVRAVPRARVRAVVRYATRTLPRARVRAVET